MVLAILIGEAITGKGKGRRISNVTDYQLSPTPFINRYSYVRNNPLNASDPSGYFLKSVFKGLAKILTDGGIIGSTIGAIFPQLKPYIQMASQIVSCSFGAVACGAFTATATYANGGSIGDAFKAGLTAAATAQLFTKIGTTFNGDPGSGFFANGGLGHIGAHAVAGGVLSELQGGKFGHGFFSAGLVKGLSGSISSIKAFPVNGKSIGQAAVAAVIGGTASKISGGKFANGAVTGAFQNLYNDQGHAQQTQGQDKNNPLGLTAENAETTFGVFYPKSPNLPSADQIGPDGVALANNLITDAAQIQGVADVVQNFGPGSVVKPGLFTMARRFATDGFKGLTRDLTFEEKLGQFGGAARGGAAINPDNRLRFNELFGGR